jgi:hypothetical protein
MSLLSRDYKEADPKIYLNFNNSWQSPVDPVFAGRLAYLFKVKGRMGNISSGFRSIEEQTRIADETLAAKKSLGYYRGSNGAIYNKNKQAMVAAPGTSNHGRGMAIDNNDDWFEALTNEQLREFGLWKSMSYEPWHCEPIETKGKTPEQRDALFYGYMEDLPMDVKKFQLINGLKPDGIVGAKTLEKAKEMKVLIDSLLKTK